MFTIAERRLTEAERATLGAEARPPASLAAIAGRRAVAGVAFGLALSATLAVPLGLGAWALGGTDAALALWAEFALGAMLLTLGLAAIDAFRARAEREARLDRAAHAALALSAGVAEDTTLTIDPAAFAIAHEHGALLVADRADGGAAVAAISTEADDPRDGMAQALASGAAVPSVWRWTAVPGFCCRVRGFETAGAPARPRLLEAHDVDPAALLEAIGATEGVDEAIRVERSAAEIATRVAALLRAA